MKSLISLVGVVFLSSNAYAFLLEGDQYLCEGSVNQFSFSIVAELKDANGESLEPKQFVGTFENMNENEEDTDASYVFSGDRDFNIYNTETSGLVGKLTKFGRVSFSRILENGSKHVTLCEKVEGRQPALVE